MRHLIFLDGIHKIIRILYDPDPPVILSVKTGRVFHFFKPGYPCPQELYEGIRSENGECPGVDSIADASYPDAMSPPFSSSDLPSFLRGGVRFGCTDCGACCGGAPGRVRLSETEVEAISEFRKQSADDFRVSETRVVDGGRLLRERGNGDCVLFENSRCSVHPVKPKQCRLYPFWFKNVRGEAAWHKTREECPGIGQGDVVSPEEILRRVREDLE